MRVHHPGKPDVDQLSGRTVIATLGRDFSVFSTNDANRFDAAIASLDDDVDHSGNTLPRGLGCPLEGRVLDTVAETSDILPGVKVGKIGRSTGYTEGWLTAVDFGTLRVRNPSINGVLTFERSMEIAWEEESRPFTRPGDSGAIVFTLDPLRAIGIHFASPRVGYSYACPLKGALDLFRADILR